MNMRYNTTRFGKIEVNPEDIIQIPDGPVGFPEYKRFIFIDKESEIPFRTLQSLEDPEFSLVVVNPLNAKPDFKVDVTLDVLKLIGAQSTENIDVYVTVRMNQNIEQITVNLKAPFLINPKTQVGFQYVIPNTSYKKNEKFLLSSN